MHKRCESRAPEESAQSAALRRSVANAQRAVLGPGDCGST